MNEGQCSKEVKSIKIEVLSENGSQTIHLSTQLKNVDETIKILKECLTLLEEEASHRSTN